MKKIKDVIEAETNYKIAISFRSPEDITFNSKLITAGTKLGPGEEVLLKCFSKAALDKLIQGGFVAEIGAGGILINKSAGITYSKNFLEGLINPNSLNTAIKLLAEKRFNVQNLEILKNKAQEVIATGINSPTLEIFLENVSNELFNKVILNEA
ncbi:MAG: hypothetical protein WC731_02130 [Candidatus Omnitrophota bacterium]|jgi:hypothetical protein